MSHLDEGTLHALLDGELDLTEVKEIQAHLGSCTACGTRLRQVKEFHSEADRLVDRLELPGATSAAGASAGRPPRGPQSAPERLRADIPDAPDGPPILLIPDNPNWADRSRRFLAPMRWAAVLLVAVGAGYVASEMRQTGALPGDVPVDSSPLASAYDTSAPVVSPEEATPRPDEGQERGAVGGRVAAPDSPARDAAPPAAPPPAPAPGQEPRKEAKTAAAAPAPAPARAEEPADEAMDSAIAANDLAVEEAAPAPRPAAQRPDQPPPDESDVRSEAAKALQDLDRERRAARAAAATAALDSARRREVALREAQARTPPAVQKTRVAAVPAAPPQRTLEQRAGTYMRIGLDEAARQLGRPVHVIEGMSPLFMGLAQGRTSPGADDTRPVVRVVYQDSQGRLILLDQQRLRPGQASAPPGSGEPHWTMAEILLHLHGEVAPEVLRNLRARVR